MVVNWFQPAEFINVNNAYLVLLNSLINENNIVEGIKDPTSIGSNFGVDCRPTIELLGISFKILNPRDRIITSRIRNVNYTFALANFLWLLSGESKLDMISHYNAKAKQFSDDGNLFSAFGYRIRTGKGDQLTNTINLLRKDSNTRRAIILIHNEYDLIVGGRDIPCATSIQFLLRNGKLNCIVYMRSQSVLMVMPYDLYLFTMLQEIIASELEVELGYYIHTCGSAHIYLDELDFARRILNEEIVNSTPMQNMTSKSFSMTPKILCAEQFIRNGIYIRGESFPNYWNELLKTLQW